MSRFRSLIVTTLAGVGICTTVAVAEESQRRAFFGETHLHTSWSIDAFAIAGSVYNGPAEAYRYARGETIRHPVGYPITITKPLDWIGVTEHAEYLGAFMLSAEEGSILRERHPFWSRTLDIGAGIKPLAAYVGLAKSMVSGNYIEAFRDPEVMKSMWQRLVAVADEYYEPGKLTTFAAYEWTAQPGNKNMHRNIFFRDTKKVPGVVFDALMSSDPYDLWTWMDGQRAAGNELLAIGHNGNLSGGLMYPTETDLSGRPIDAAWAEHRRRNEPLTELKQGKGQSETTPALSPNDEFADYEILEWQLLGAEDEGAPLQRGSYVRRAFRDGLALQDIGGFNPHKFGLVAGADTHNAAAPYRQNNYFGIHASFDGTPELRLGEEKQMGLDNRQIAPPGLSAVWADANTREGIFDGLKRKETYATSGVRITLRFFGGWDFQPAMLDGETWVADAYARGVPMGGDLPQPGSANAPTFVVHATKDPDSGNLDRVQVIKGWSDRGQSFEKIYDVAWAGDRVANPDTHRVGPVGSTVNLADASYSNTIGTTELKAVWTDPDFEPSLDAFYYVRVLEIPTPRWTLLQSRDLGQAPPENVRLTVQERAWSSPIWYTPDASARRGRPAGEKVADLVAQGARALDDGELKQLIVGKSILVRNAVTGNGYELFYGTDGRRLVSAVHDKDGNAVTSTGSVYTFSAGTVASYRISGGTLSTSLETGDLHIKVYRKGQRYVAARDDEFGYANYELVEIGD